MSVILKIIQVTFWLIGVIVLYMAYQYYLKPKRLVNFYKKQGLDMFFSFGTGIHDRDFRNSSELGDYAHYEKAVVSKNLHYRVYGGNLGKYCVLHLFDPQLIKEFTQIQAQHYKKSNLYDLIRIAADKGIVFSEGERWKTHKKILSAVLQYDFLKEMVPIVVETTLSHFEQIKKDKTEQINARNEFESITGELVGKLFFGEDFSKHKIEGLSLSSFLKVLTTEGWGLTWTLWNLTLGPNFVKKRLIAEHRRILGRVDIFTKFCNDRVQERMDIVTADRKKARSNSLMDLLILSSMDNPNFTREDITDEFATLCAAGMDTTGHTLAMCTYYYVTNPKCHQKLQAEITAYLGDPKKITFESVGKMEYMQAFLMETLRLGAPTFRTFLREAIDDHKLADIDIKKGTLIDLTFFPNNYSEVFHDKPLEFNPERLVDPNSKTRQSMLRDPFCFVPFSCGPRICIGQHLALMESKIIFGLFIKNFKFQLPSDYEMQMVCRFLYEPRDDLVYDIQQYDKS